MTYDIDQFQHLLDSIEGEHCEFKEAKSSFEFDKALRYCAAMANEGGGKLVLGVTDKRPRCVVGTDAFLQYEKTRTSLIEKLHIKIDVEEINHQDGRVLIFTVSQRPWGVPIGVDGRYWMRRGESLVPMPPERLREIFEEIGHDFSADICDSVSIEDLDTCAIEEYRQRWLRKSGNTSLLDLPVLQLLEDSEAVVTGGITYAALVLFGTRDALTRHLSHCEVVFEYRSSEAAGPAQDRREFRKAFFSYYDELWDLVNLRNDLQHFQDGLFVLDIPTFEDRSIREAILNAVAHRDYRLSGSVFIRQYPRRIVVESPGGFPLGITEDNVLDRQTPRNRRIAELLAKCGLVERSGQGMNLMFEEAIRHGKQPPDFTGTDSYQVTLNLDGQIRDPALIRFLEMTIKETGAAFSTQDLLILDAIHRNLVLRESWKIRLGRLVEIGVVERVSRGRGTSYTLSRRFYRLTGSKGAYTRKRGLDRETNKQLLLKHIRENRASGSQLGELRQVLPNHTRGGVQSLLRELKKEGHISLKGQRNQGKWYPTNPPKV